MVEKLHKLGYNNVTKNGIYKCINSEGEIPKHAGFNFTSYPIDTLGTITSSISQMNLLQIIEMLVDWKAASERHEDGNIIKSILHNQKRFKMSDQLTAILINTAQALWEV